MNRWLQFLAACTLLAGLLFITGCGNPPVDPVNSVDSTPTHGVNPQTGLPTGVRLTAEDHAEAAKHIVPRWHVVEIELKGDAETAKVDNPFQDVTAIATIVPPDGNETFCYGFYDGDNTWRFRLAPMLEGDWKIDASLALTKYMADIHPPTYVPSTPKATHCFHCEGQQGHGFVRRAKDNPYRFQWEDGTPYYPIGIQPGSHIMCGLDGPLRGTGPWRSVDFETYLTAFDGAANLFRIQWGHGGTPEKPSHDLITGAEGLERYSLENARALDKALIQLRAHGFAVILTPFEDMSLWGSGRQAFGSTRDIDGWKNSQNEKAYRPAQEYLQYLVARYAAYVDIWEMFNEDASTPNATLEDMWAQIKSNDPHKHIVTTNYERPTQRFCELISCHEYMWMPPSEVDAHLCKEFARLKSFNKPVLYTEFGNQGQLSNKDPIKWRIAQWTAFMNESAILFWHMGGIETTVAAPGEKRSGNANAYLGPEARGYFRVLHTITKDLPTKMRPIIAAWGDQNENLNRMALSDGQTTLVYIHHMSDHETKTKGLLYLWLGRGNYQFTWLDPATGETLKTETKKAAIEVLTTEVEVQIDLACRIDKLPDTPPPEPTPATAPAPAP